MLRYFQLDAVVSKVNIHFSSVVHTNLWSHHEALSP